MQENEDKKIDLIGTLGSFIEEEIPEMSPEDAIKHYKGEDQNYAKKKKKANVENDEENEDDEHLKRVKQALLESLEKVDNMAKKIFDQKDKDNLKNLKVKPNRENIKEREQPVNEKMKKDIPEEKQAENDRSREGW